MPPSHTYATSRRRPERPKHVSESLHLSAAWAAGGAMADFVLNCNNPAVAPFPSGTCTAKNQSHHDATSASHLPRRRADRDPDPRQQTTRSGATLAVSTAGAARGERRHPTV